MCEQKHYFGYNKCDFAIGFEITFLSCYTKTPIISVYNSALRNTCSNLCTLSNINICTLCTASPVHSNPITLWLGSSGNLRIVILLQAIRIRDFVVSSASEWRGAVGST